MVDYAILSIPLSILSLYTPNLFDISLHLLHSVCMWGIMVFCLIFLPAFLINITHTYAQTDPGFRIALSEEERFMGPIDFFDTPFNTIPISGGVRAYTGTIAGTSADAGSSLTFFGTNLNHLGNGTVTIRKGQAGNFDECGVWLNSVYKIDEQNLYGFYHAEDKCNYAAGYTHKSMGFARSYDGGVTWQKPNYPNNKILSADTAFDSDVNRDDAGDGSVIRIGNYFYNFFLASADWRIHAARAPVNSPGDPSQWKKYYINPVTGMGDFTEPALGGKSSPLPFIVSSHVYFNSYLQKYIEVSATGLQGFQFFYTNGADSLHWNPGFILYPSVSYEADPRVDKWYGDRASLMKLYGYSSLVGQNGENDYLGQSFYLYYLKIFPGYPYSNQYMMRRRVTTYKNTVDPYYTKVELVRYKKSGRNKTKVSTELAKPEEGYQKIQSMGYLLPYPQTGFQPLYECYIPVWDDYLITTADPSAYNWQHCESSGDVFVRRIGWISNSRINYADMALYRCFDQANLDHFLSTDTNCEGKTREWLFGYAFSTSYSDISPTPYPTAMITPIPTNTPTLYIQPSHTPIPCPRGNMGNLDCSVNGCIGTSDFQLFREYFGASADNITVPAGQHTPDLVNDDLRIINTADYEMFRSNFGSCN